MGWQYFILGFFVWIIAITVVRIWLTFEECVSWNRFSFPHNTAITLFPIIKIVKLILLEIFYFWMVFLCVCLEMGHFYCLVNFSGSTKLNRSHLLSWISCPVSIILALTFLLHSVLTILETLKFMLCLSTGNSGNISVRIEIFKGGKMVIIKRIVPDILKEEQHHRYYC